MKHIIIITIVCLFLANPSIIAPKYMVTSSDIPKDMVTSFVIEKGTLIIEGDGILSLQLVFVRTGFKNYVSYNAKKSSIQLECLRGDLLKRGARLISLPLYCSITEPFLNL